jgi:hypothetical protein
MTTESEWSLNFYTFNEIASGSIQLFHTIRTYVAFIHVNSTDVWSLNEFEPPARKEHKLRTTQFLLV